MPDPQRVYRSAIYLAPRPGSALAGAAAEWFMPDPVRDKWLAEPLRYGFHGTLKAPFRLADGMDFEALEQAVAILARAIAPLPDIQLRPEILGSFIALVPRAEDKPALQGLCDIVVRYFDRFRAPLSEAEIAKRRKAELTPEQDALMLRWGYPYVFDEFRFHMTLTGPLPEEEREPLLSLARNHFALALAEPMPVDRLWLFVEPSPGAFFRPLRHFALSGRATPADLT